MSKDIFKTSSMSYMETMDAYTLMKELWNSDFDMSGDFWD